MKPVRWSLAIGVAASIAGIGMSAKANQVPNGTYVFEALDGNNALNGSTVTFQNDVLTGWNLVDSLDHTDPLPMTTANSHIASDGILGPNAWYFTIDANTGPDYFEGQNNAFGDLGGGAYGALYDQPGDPNGNWTPVAAPDAFSTLPLLGIGLFALGSGRAWLLRRVQI